MANPTAALRPNTTGPFPSGPEGMLAEPVQVTGVGGSAVGTTVDYVMRFLNDPQMISPGYSIDAIVKSGLLTTVTIELQHAIEDGAVEDIEIKGFIG